MPVHSFVWLFIPKKMHSLAFYLPYFFSCEYSDLNEHENTTKMHTSKLRDTQSHTRNQMLLAKFNDVVCAQRSWIPCQETKKNCTLRLNGNKYARETESQRKNRRNRKWQRWKPLTRRFKRKKRVEFTDKINTAQKLNAKEITWSNSYWWTLASRNNTIAEMGKLKKEPTHSEQIQKKRNTKNCIYRNYVIFVHVACDWTIISLEAVTILSFRT